MAAIFLLLSLTIFVSQYFIDGRRIDIFDPKTLFQCYFIVQLPLVLFVGIYSDFPGFAILSSNTPSEEVLFLGSVFLMAHLAMVVGYYAIGRKAFPFPGLASARWKYGRVRMLCGLYFVIGYLAFFYLLQINGGYAAFVENREVWRAGGMSGQGWLIFPATSLLSMAAIAYVIVSGDKFLGKRGAFRLLMLAALTILPASQMGFRGLMLLPVIQILFIYHHRIQRLEVAKILPLLAGLVIAFTAYGLYREIHHLMADGFDIEIAAKFIAERPEFLYAIFLRSKGADIVASVIRQLGDMGGHVMFLSAAIEALTIPIPSALWAGKPVPLSVKFSEQFFGISGGVSPTIVGEAYWHGGLAGIVVVMVTVGVFFRLYRNCVRRSVNKNSVIFLLTAIFPSLVMMAEAVQGYLNGIVLIVIFGTLLIASFSVRIRISNRAGNARLDYFP